MVQRPIPQGDLSFPRDNSWMRNERPPYLDASHEHRFAPSFSPVHPGPLTIEAALKDCARIGFKEFGLVVITDNGDLKSYSSPSLVPYQQRFFTDEFCSRFRRAAKKVSDNAYSSPAYAAESMHSEFELESESVGRKGSGSSEGRTRYRKSRSEDSDEDISSGSRGKKRARYPAWRENSNDDTPIPVPVQKTQQLMIGDSAEVEKFYACRFKDMQQSSCKVMGKAFVKLVEPKKQTHHPYTKGDGKAPPWWPPTTGDDNVRVRHKEPDHLLKPERIRLLVHILRMIIEPRDKQHITVQKLGLDVKKLEEVTMEAMSNWFNDKEHPENAQKRPFLKEIFKIAKAEERYKNGEIDGTTVIPVMYGERSGSGDGDGSDDEGDEPSFKPEDDEHDMPPNTTSNLSTPDSMVSPLTGPSRHLQSEHDSNNMGMRSSLPVRPMDDHFNDPSSFFPRGLGVNFQQPRSPSLQDPSRGHGQFVSPQSSFHNTQMFWQPNIVSNASSNNFYVTSPQTTLPPSSSPYNPLPLPNPQQTMLPPPPINTQHSFDGLPVGRAYDSSPALGSQLRTGSMGHPHQLPQHHGFQEYLQDSGNFGHHESDLKDQQQHHIHPS
ncbi:hypothetical protein N431DRAFT_327065 [Stipitochalara longipes BDJ]|nr:hypothetical protein N431DRAFT_327065 [Stipitochalara longipes BDJ]